MTKSIRALQQTIAEIVGYGLYGPGLNQPYPLCGSPALVAWLIYSWRLFGSSPFIRTAPLDLREVTAYWAGAVEAAADQGLDLHPIRLRPHSIKPSGKRQWRPAKEWEAQVGGFLQGVVALGAPTGPVERKPVRGILLFSPSGKRLFHFNVFPASVPEWHSGMAGIWVALSRTWSWATPKVQARVSMIVRDAVMHSLLTSYPESAAHGGVAHDISLLPVVPVPFPKGAPWPVSTPVSATTV
jgi:hypothetical protein